ncbi:MAG: protein kinase [Caldilinea sp.]|nr:protein kinase [Caldilinea sp.]MDW8439420.1 protein kinase [Caldilineaceae bacterium]
MLPAGRSSFDSRQGPLTSPRAAMDAARGLLTGYQLGRYRLEARLGGGVMAAVYRGINVETRQTVAVKVLLPDADATVRERFRQEARTHRRLVHPHIVPVLEEGCEASDGITYLVMALVEGPGLNEVLEARDRLGVRDAAAILAPIARALTYAHAQGVVHRDVKPGNILLQPSGANTSGAVFVKALGSHFTPLLGDFGIARALDSPELTGMGRTIGTPTYMSPEQCADSHEIDGRSDLYSLGAVFYRCLVGRPPFTGSTTQILHAHVYEALTIPESVLATLPSPAVEVLRRCLAKDPADRYPSGDALAEALEELLQAPTIHEETPVEATATMPALQAVSAAPANVRVLVPGVQPRPAEPEQRRPPPAHPATQPSIVPPLVAVAAPTRKRWPAALLGVALSALLLFGAGWAALRLLPDAPLHLLASVGAIDAATPAPVDAPPLSAVGAVDTPGPVASPTPPPSTATAPVAVNPHEDVNSQEDAAPTPPPTSTLPPESTVTLTAEELQQRWREAEEALAAQNWQAAIDAYTLIRHVNPDYERETLTARLFESRIGLATEHLVAERLELAAQELELALSLRPNEETAAPIQRALAALLSMDPADAQPVRQNLWGALVNYAGRLEAEGRVCSAVSALQAAVAVLPEGAADTPLAQFEAECARAQALADIEKTLAAGAGRILYSTQEGDRYNIYAAPAQVGGVSTLLIADGAQVSPPYAGSLLAFHSAAFTEPGIALFDLAASLGPAERTQRITQAAEDARDAPPSWSPDGAKIVYSSTRTSPGRPRMYVRSLNTGEEIDLGFGKDPTWEPGGERILFNGFDDRGENPGLYLINADGSNRQRLTDNGNDLRPVWSPDGDSVVFMSTRDGDMDVYRLSLRDGSLVQLTNDPAQDGLPAISPDGRLVVFASDRGGVWRLYVTPIDGGPTVPLLEIQGVLVNWLEHSVQWTR